MDHILQEITFSLYTVAFNSYNCSFNNGHGPCGQICNVLSGSVYCSCESGYMLLEDHLHCLSKSSFHFMSRTSACM